MAIPWGLVAFVVGIVYGYAKKGRQEKMAIFKTGLLWGIVIAAVFALLGAVAGVNPLGVGTGFLALAISAVVLVLLFVLGVFIGDWVEHRKAPAGH